MLNKQDGRVYTAKSYEKSRITEGALHTLKEEIRLLRKLNHPNIPKMIEIQETEESIYLIFDSFKGIPLTSLIDLCGPSMEIMSNVTLCLLRIMDYFYSEGLNPQVLNFSNIVVNPTLDEESEKSPNFELKVVDFYFAEKQVFLEKKFLKRSKVEKVKNYQKNEEEKIYSTLKIGVFLHKIFFGFPTNNFSNFMTPKEYEVEKEAEDELPLENLEFLDLLEKMLVDIPGKMLSIDDALKSKFILKYFGNEKIKK